MSILLFLKTGHILGLTWIGLYRETIPCSNSDIFVRPRVKECLILTQLSGRALSSLFSINAFLRLKTCSRVLDGAIKHQTILDERGRCRWNAFLCATAFLLSGMLLCVCTCVSARWLQQNARVICLRLVMRSSYPGDVLCTDLPCRIGHAVASILKPTRKQKHTYNKNSGRKFKKQNFLLTLKLQLAQKKGRCQKQN